MISVLIKFFETCGVKNISITSLVAFILGASLVFAGAEYRYMPRTEAERQQYYQQQKLKIEIMMLELKEEGVAPEIINKKVKEEFKKLLDEMEKK